MKKGDNRPDPGEELLYHLSSKKEFQQDILKARKHFGIPEKGFANEDMRDKCIKDDMNFDLMAIELYFQKKYKISIAYLFHVDDYIFFGKLIRKKKSSPSVVFDRYAHRKDVNFGNMEEFYRETGEPYAKVFILGNASKSDVLDYINKNWEIINDILYEQRGGPRKVVRETFNKERNLRIKELSRKSIEELRLLADKADPGNSHQTSKYKDLLIKIILRKKYSRLSDGYIRKIAAEK